MTVIGIRADGGKNIGMGHIMRTLVLAKELAKKNEVIFISIKNKKDDFRAGIEKVISQGFKVIEINDVDIINELEEIQDKYSFNCLITDSYRVNEEYFDSIKKIFDKIGYIDDINICKFNVDFLINQNIDASNHMYEFYNFKETKVFLGTEYCLLRDEFRGNNSDKNIKKYVEDILITLGGMDNESNTLKILNELKDLDVNFHVVIGSAFEEDLILKLNEIKKTRNNIFLYKNAIMSEIMKKSDLAISASGSTLYELCAMQVPVIGLVIADNQKNICSDMNEKKIIIGIEDPVEDAIKKLKDVVFDIIDDKDKRLMLVENQKRIVNSNGVLKTANEINKIIKNTSYYGK